VVLRPRTPAELSDMVVDHFPGIVGASRSAAQGRRRAAEGSVEGPLSGFT
jgi:hypothetical protein